MTTPAYLTQAAIDERFAALDRLVYFCQVCRNWFPVTTHTTQHAGK